MKYSILILVVIIITSSVFGQKGEHYISKYCDCYVGFDLGIAYHEKYLKPFTPTHSEVDSTEIALKMTHYNFKKSIEPLDYYIRYYNGFINEHGHRSLHIWADWKEKNKFDGEWEVN